MLVFFPLKFSFASFTPAVFYVYNEGVHAGPDGRDVRTGMETGLDMWKTNIVEDAKVAACFWLPVQTFNFKFVPLHLRIPYLGVAGLVWVGMISALRGGGAEEDDVFQHEIRPVLGESRIVAVSASPTETSEVDRVRSCSIAFKRS